ncbi:Chromosome partition protein Smc [Carpediemonas membranifera]|uniref:Chromosome partition protein Smc n=1 Tax=Carpediemonas membranifera TaxID=201153 RepID=A0A8J6E1Y7_9EUKA|nr:Chromosome partition protein Smc [Carpediemonas membranifera]|eukprot:KAG9391237.1 Chromosome partition protein Smc [Carpediemonas membranifera]
MDAMADKEDKAQDGAPVHENDVEKQETAEIVENNSTLEEEHEKQPAEPEEPQPEPEIEADHIQTTIALQTDPPEIAPALVRLHMAVSTLRTQLADKTKALETERTNCIGKEQTHVEERTVLLQKVSELERTAEHYSAETRARQRDLDMAHQQLEELNATHESRTALLETQMGFLVRQLQSIVAEKNVLQAEAERIADSLKQRDQHQDALADFQTHLEAQVSSFKSAHAAVETAVASTDETVRRFTQRQDRLMKDMAGLGAALETTSAERDRAVAEAAGLRDDVAALKEALAVLEARVPVPIARQSPAIAALRVPAMPELTGLERLGALVTTTVEHLSNAAAAAKAAVTAADPPQRPGLEVRPVDQGALDDLKQALRATRARLEEESTRRVAAEGRVTVLVAKLQASEALAALELPVPDQESRVDVAVQTEKSRETVSSSDRTPTSARTGSTSAPSSVTIATHPSRAVARNQRTARGGSCELCGKAVDGWGCVRCSGCGKKAHRSCVDGDYTCGGCAEFAGPDSKRARIEA